MLLPPFSCHWLKYFTSAYIFISKIHRKQRIDDLHSEHWAESTFRQHYFLIVAMLCLTIQSDSPCLYQSKLFLIAYVGCPDASGTSMNISMENMDMSLRFLLSLQQQNDVKDVELARPGTFLASRLPRVYYRGRNPSRINLLKRYREGGFWGAIQ